VPKQSFCDGKIDCSTRVDEPEDCKLCGSYLRIVDPNKICDGNRNCMDKSDEAWSICGCREGYFRCYATGHCIPPSFECDGETDCPDGEDEQNCVAVRSQRSNV
jgi:Low-density lipoprotein receptor domain class A